MNEGNVARGAKSFGELVSQYYEKSTSQEEHQHWLERTPWGKSLHKLFDLWRCTLLASVLFNLLTINGGKNGGGWRWKKGFPTRRSVK